MYPLTIAVYIAFTGEEIRRISTKGAQGEPPQRGRREVTESPRGPRRYCYAVIDPQTHPLLHAAA